MYICSHMTIMKYNMPAKSAVNNSATAAKLIALGPQIRAHRKALRVSATTVAQAAGMSRMTLHRIERGEASVTMGAYLNAMAALGLEFGILAPPVAAAREHEQAAKGEVPARIRLADYPQLKRLAWHVHGIDALTPAEALGIYERNARHLDTHAMTPRERHLVEALHAARGRSQADV